MPEGGAPDKSCMSLLAGGRVPQYRSGRDMHLRKQGGAGLCAMAACGLLVDNELETRMNKTAARLLLPFLMLTVLAGPASAEAPAVPAAFGKWVPREFADGLRLVELRQRCADCAPWRIVEVVADDPAGQARQEKVSVAAGVTAMYAYPGSGFFANAKIEKSLAGRFDGDRAIVSEALEHACVRSRKDVESWLRAHPLDKEKLDRVVAGRDYVEFERGSYRGVEYMVCTQNGRLASPNAMPAMLHVFMPRAELIVTAYLMKQDSTRFGTLAAFRQAQRAFIEGYIDYAAGADSK